MHYVDCRMPNDLYEWLRTTAFHTRRSMNSVVSLSVKAYRDAVEAGGLTPSRASPASSPPIRYRPSFDDEVYEWLRTTAFHTRLPINALLVAALAHYRDSVVSGRG